MNVEHISESIKSFNATHKTSTDEPILKNILLNMQVTFTQFNCNVAFEFIFETNGVNTRNCFHDSRFSVSYMTNCANINGGLTRNYLR